jgi:hypothetical protein
MDSRGASDYTFVQIYVCDLPKERNALTPP